MSNRGSQSSCPRRRRKPSRPLTGLVLERRPRSVNELLNAILGLDAVDLDATAHVHAYRADLSNRGTDIVRIQAPGEQERAGGADLFRPLPVRPSASSTGNSLGIAFNQNSYRR